MICFCRSESKTLSSLRAIFVKIGQLFNRLRKERGEGSLRGYVGQISLLCQRYSKVVPVNTVQAHTVNRGTAPHTLSLGAGWRWAVSLTTLLLATPRKTSYYKWTGNNGTSRTFLVVLEKRKYLSSTVGIRTPDHSTPSLVAVTTTLSRPRCDYRYFHWCKWV
jgi:hypothetical protein